MVDFDDFDLGPQSDESFDADLERDEAFEGFEDEPEEPFDRDGWDDQAALDSVYGPDDDTYSDFDGYECPEFDD